jgi:ATP-dependent Clp protease, protease subunit
MNKLTLPKLQLPQAVAGLGWELPKSALARWNAGLQARQAENTIGIYEPIGADPWTGGGVTAKTVAKQLRDIGDQQVNVDINSPGGDVFEGFAIYNLLRDHPRKVTVRVVGMAASAASLIAMAGDSIQVARAGFLMIHNIWVYTAGNRNELRAIADMLEPFDSALADVYVARSGIDKTDIAAMLDKETWLSGEQAVEDGFADTLMPADQVKEDKGNTPDANAALRRIDVALAKQGMPRSERRALLNQIKGTPDAAREPTHDAGDEMRAEAREFVESLGSIIKPI